MRRKNGQTHHGVSTEERGTDSVKFSGFISQEIKVFSPTVHEGALDKQHGDRHRYSLDKALEC